jgi:predicted nucleotidyltransferase
MTGQEFHKIKKKLYQTAPDIFGGRPVLFAYLYGSYTKGAAHAFSDLDVAVCVEGLEVKACLELELSLGLRVDEKLDHMVQSDVRVINHLPLVVKGRILTEGEMIYSIAEDRRVEFETQVRMAYFDFLPMLLQYRDAYRQKLLLGRAHGVHR